jgi:hypothetical protein
VPALSVSLTDITFLFTEPTAADEAGAASKPVHLAGIAGLGVAEMNRPKK